MLYAFLRDIIFAPLLKRSFEIEVIGLENVPERGRLVIASNHEAVIDSFLILALIKRRITFLAKMEYFNSSGLMGLVSKKFFGIAAIPVDRTSKKHGTQAVEQLSSVLLGDGVVALHPEGTRTPGDKVYRGRSSGVIPLAWRTNALVLPVALRGTSIANPPGKRLPRLRSKITMTIGKPMEFEAPLVQRGPTAALNRRAQTRQLMEEIARLADLPYIDQDAGKVKKALAKGNE